MTISRLRGTKWRPSERDGEVALVTASTISKQLKEVFCIQLKRGRPLADGVGYYKLTKSNETVHSVSAISDYYKQGAWIDLPTSGCRVLEGYSYNPETEVFTKSAIGAY